MFNNFYKKINFDILFIVLLSVLGLFFCSISNAATGIPYYLLYGNATPTPTMIIMVTDPSIPTTQIVTMSGIRDYCQTDVPTADYAILSNTANIALTLSNLNLSQFINDSGYVTAGIIEDINVSLNNIEISLTSHANDIIDLVSSMSIVESSINAIQIQIQNLPTTGVTIPSELPDGVTPSPDDKIHIDRGNGVTQNYLSIESITTYIASQVAGSGTTVEGAVTDNYTGDVTVNGTLTVTTLNASAVGDSTGTLVLENNDGINITVNISLRDNSGSLYSTEFDDIIDSSATGYELLPSDNNHVIYFSSSDPVTVTISAEADVDWKDGTRFIIVRWGTGTVTIVGGSGINIRVPSGITTAISNQYSAVGIFRKSSGEWLLIGDLPEEAPE